MVIYMTYMISGKKEIRELVKVAVDLEYDVKRMSNNHIKISGNNGISFIVGSTPRTYNEVLDIKRKLKKIGPNLLN